MTRTYRCRSCEATWVRYPEGETIDEVGRCLRCDGIIVLEDPEDDRDLEDDAET